LSLPTAVRHRWPLDRGGKVDLVDLGFGVLTVPAGHAARLLETTSFAIGWSAPIRAFGAREPRCSIALSIRDADVVVEGDAARVTDQGTLARVAQAWADGGWPAAPDESGVGITAPFNAPSQGPPPWHVYRIEPRSATVVLGIEPGGLTRFRF
jgi:hypothetical protein